MNYPDTLQQAVDTLRTAGQPSAYDSVWASSLPSKPPTPLEAIMLSHDKIFVVLAVVLIIWLGISIFVLRTDKKLDALERLVEDRISEEDTL
jgi:CcmD family protein